MERPDSGRAAEIHANSVKRIPAGSPPPLSVSILFKFSALTLLLIAADQLSKLLALLFTPSVYTVMRHSAHWVELGLWMHRPDAWSTYVAFGAFALAGVLWKLPISRIVKVLWTSAILSNHVEMLVRPGTVDFLAIRAGRHLFILNLADLYFVAGSIVLLAWLVQRIRMSKSWLERQESFT